MLEDATVAPLSGFHWPLDQKLKKYLVPYLRSELDAREAMRKVKAELDAERQKIVSGRVR